LLNPAAKEILNFLKVKKYSLLNPAAKEILNEWILNNLQHSYPTEDAKIFLSIKTKLSVH